MESTETPNPTEPVKLRKDQLPVTAEEYARIKADYPHLDWHDEDQSYTSKQGRKAYARKLLYFKPLTEEQRIMGRAAFAEQRQDQWDKFITHLSTGMRISDAAKRVGLTYRTVKERYKADPAFAERWEEAEQQAAEPIEDALFDAARNGNVPAAVKWLEKRAPERWPGDKVQIEQKNIYELDASDRIANVIALMAKLQQRAELASGPEVIDVTASEPE